MIDLKGWFCEVACVFSAELEILILSPTPKTVRTSPESRGARLFEHARLFERIWYIILTDCSWWGALKRVGALIRENTVDCHLMSSGGVATNNSSHIWVSRIADIVHYGM